MRSSNFNSRAFKIALIYLTIGIVYIIFSDILAGKNFGYPDDLSKIQTYKGLIFVLITALIIYFLILSEFLKHKKSEKQLSEKYIKELKQKNDFIQTVLDNIPIGIALNKFNEGHATYMNKRFLEIYGWPEEEMTDIETFFRKAYPDNKYREEIYNRIMKDIESGDPERMRWHNIRATRKNGDIRIINAVNIPLIEQNTMVSTVMDVTEQKNFETSLKDSRAFITSILDNLPVGISVSIDMHDKIFERFRQVENTYLSKYGGTGLGLSISRGLVELLGGEIWIDSEPGKGSAFYFTIKQG